MRHIIVLALATCLLSSADAQEEYGGYRVLRERKGDGEVAARFVKLEGTTVHLLGENGQPLQMPLSDLSRDDQVWIRLKEKQRLDLEKQLQLISRDLEDFATSSDKQQMQSMSRILAVGELAAPVALGPLDEAIKHAESAAMRYLLLTTRWSIAEKNEANLSRLLDLADPSKSGGLTAAVHQDPQPFFIAVARYGSLGTEYLTNIAYSASIQPAKAFDKPLTKPETLDSITGPANAIRALAADALCQTRDPGIAEPLGKLVRAAMVKVNGIEDRATLTVILSNFGDLGIRSQVIEDALKKYARLNPAIQASQTKLDAWKKMRSLQNKADRLAEYRTFNLRQGNAQLFARLERLSANEMVRLLDENNNRLVIPLSNFSAEDQKWINAQ